MGVAYYVDGVLSDARTAWGLIESGAGVIWSHSVEGLTVIDNYLVYDGVPLWVGQTVHFFSIGDSTEPQERRDRHFGGNKEPTEEQIKRDDLILKCTAEQLGLTTLFGGAAVGSGLPTQSKRFQTPGSSPGTSLASETFSQALPYRSSRRLWAPTFFHPFSTTTRYGRFVGRWIPGVGLALWSWDAYKISKCVEGRVNQ